MENKSFSDLLRSKRRLRSIGIQSEAEVQLAKDAKNIWINGTLSSHTEY